MKTRTAYLSFLWVLALVAHAFSQDGASDAKARFTSDSVKAWMQAAESAPNLPETTKGQLKAAWQKSLVDLQRADESKRRADGLKQKTASAAEDAAAADKALEEFAKQSVSFAEIDGLTDPSKIESRLATAEADAAQKAAQVTTLENEARSREDRRKQIPSLRDVEQARLEEARQKLAGAAPAVDPLDPAFALFVQWNAQRLAAEAELASLDLEVPSYDARSRLLRTETDRAHLEVERQNALVERLRKVLQDARAREAADEKKKAEEAAHKQNDHPLLAEAARENLAIVKRRTDPDGYVAKIEKATNLLAELKKKAQEQQERFEQAKNYIDTVGLSDELAQVLQQPAESKATTRDHIKAIEERDQQLSELGFARIALERQRREVRDPTGAARASFEGYTRNLDQIDYTDLVERKIDKKLEDLFVARREALDDAIDDIGRLTRIDLELNETERKLIDLTNQYSEYVDARVVWLRNTSVLGPSDLLVALDRARRLPLEEHPIETMVELGKDVAQHWPYYVGFLVGVGLLMHYRRRMREKYRTVDVNEVGFLNAAKPIFYGVLEALFATLPVVLAFEFVARRCLQLTGNDPARAVAQSLRHGMAIVFPLFLLLRLMWRDGLFERHLGWLPESLTRLRHLTRGYIYAVVPLLCIYYYFVARPTLDPSEPLARLCFIAALIATSVFGFSMAKPAIATLQVIAKGDPGRIMLRRIILIGLIGYGPIVIAALSAYGYHTTAHRLFERLYPTTVVIAAILIIIQLFDAWFYMARRAEALARLRKRREELIEQQKALAEKSGKKDPPDGAVEMPALEVNEIDLRKINAQARELVRGTSAAIFLVALWFIWQDVLPALRVLDTVTLWEVKQTVGTAVVARAITLVDLIGALVTLTLSWMIARNVPSLFEALVLSNLPIDAGARYAIVTLMRYVITLVGIALIFERLGVGWEDFQWLVAAISVGLGFGLQEIFGNFVSGIILLFERPLRVGDTVTVSGVSGLVTKIRMRATTILDGDNKEHIIPNKNMITGSVVNWVLSSPTIRVQFDISVAYGTDTRKVEQLLVAIARSHAEVVDEPAPGVVFTGFGESSLDFQLSAFVRSPSVAGKVRTEINRAIDESFKRQGIVIPYPTQEVIRHDGEKDHLPV